MVICHHILDTINKHHKTIDENDIRNLWHNCLFIALFLGMADELKNRRKQKQAYWKRLLFS
jgi:hypothetical protein